MSEPSKTHPFNAEALMIKEVFTLTPNTTVKEAIQLLLEKKVSGAPIVDGAGKAITVVGQTDLMKFAATGGMNKKLLDYLEKLSPTAKLITVTKQDPFKEIFRQFLSFPVRRILVTDASGKLHGIISRSIILKAFMEMEGA